ncbi:serine--tRNA ligase [Candidatus Woesearchaeota archaeon]|nr:serine--tRNA ligase [Candidatus Woesearchaeota archaeon]
MIDIKILRENPELIRKNFEKRRIMERFKEVEVLREKDETWRQAKFDLQKLKHSKNTISQEINQLKKAKKPIDSKLKELKELPKKIEREEQKVDKLKEEIGLGLMNIPNFLHDSVPAGEGEEGNKQEKLFGKKPKFDFKPKSHVDIIDQLDLADTGRAAKISGSRFWFLKGDLAMLDLALQKYAIDFMTKRGYVFVYPPFMMNRKAYEGVISFDDFGEMMYKVDGEDLYLIATSEHPLTAQFMDEVLDESAIPLKFVGLSTNFRREAGSHGKDTKGIFRGHQFNKVEQIIICKPEQSWKFHEELIRNAEEFFQSLGLHFRKVNICTGDIGSIAAKKYDLEVWMPVQDAYREVVSCSNCTDYQARRLNIRYRTKDGSRLVHTLNATCVATSRALVAILENFQNKDGSIAVPEVLVPYVGKRIIKKPK